MHDDPAPPTRHLRVRKEHGHTVLEFHGEIDILAAMEIIPHVDSATEHPEPLLVIDLRPVEFFDCSGLRVLYGARRRVLAQGGRIHLVCTHEMTLRILKATGLACLLPPSATLNEALSLPEDPSGTS